MTVATAELLDRGVTGRLAARLAGRVQSANQPWAAQVVSWLDLVDLCRELDENLDTGSASEEALALHEAVVSLALGCGSWLLHQIRVSNADISASGQTLETLDASLELLRIMQRRRHPQFAPAEIEAVRRRVFNAAA